MNRDDDPSPQEPLAGVEAQPKRTRRLRRDAACRQVRVLRVDVLQREAQGRILRFDRIRTRRARHDEIRRCRALDPLAVCQMLEDERVTPVVGMRTRRLSSPTARTPLQTRPTTLASAPADINFVTLEARRRKSLVASRRMDGDLLANVAAAMAWL